MSPFAAFILGLLIGLIVEWIIDWLYWRRRLEAQHSEFAQTESSLEAKISTLNQQISELKQEKSSQAEQLDTCLGKLSAFNAPTSGLPAEPAEPSIQDMEPTLPLTKAASIEPDDLVIIKGIGPVINRRLNQAGIVTFEQLAAITPARLREIVGDVIQRLSDEDTIINQAKELAAKKAGRG